MSLFYYSTYVLICQARSIPNCAIPTDKELSHAQDAWIEAISITESASQLGRLWTDLVQRQRTALPGQPGLQPRPKAKK